MSSFHGAPCQFQAESAEDEALDTEVSDVFFFLAEGVVKYVVYVYLCVSVRIWSFYFFHVMLIVVFFRDHISILYFYVVI